MSKKHSKLPAYQQRLQAREQLLEQRALDYERQLKEKQAYLKSNGKVMVSNQIIQNVGNKNPFLGKMTNKVLGSPLSKEQLPVSKKRNKNKQNFSNTDELLKRLARVGSAAIPVIYSIGGRKLLSNSFRTAGKLIRRSIGSLLGIKRKRKK